MRVPLSATWGLRRRPSRGRQGDLPETRRHSPGLKPLQGWGSAVEGAWFPGIMLVTVETEELFDIGGRRSSLGQGQWLWGSRAQGQ